MDLLSDFKIKLIEIWQDIKLLVYLGMNISRIISQCIVYKEYAPKILSTIYKNVWSYLIIGISL